ncbi:ROK family transcriptional regulator [Domibacillus enclensis]|uniref:Transcriptional regulator /xylose repressor, XylR n=1 Tax=Domibacillus enclensis TaxID=1017273 RepID=A0A1N6Y8S8_9BACI|nr:ROK family protein [Domibacillus enclensis]OXS77556.1 XylR family transcriptional regulator [Domibacillus enclensis]SIR10964.1 transcriptional regulator /xylose repressor, XylR [Domibacillus enclensis]
MTIADQNLVKKMNRRRLLQEVIHHSPISRASLSKTTGLNKSTVSAQIQGLVDEKFIFEIGQGQSSGGRRPVMLMFNKQAGYAIGVDIGVDDLTVLLTDLDGSIVSEHYFELEQSSVNETMALLLKTIEQVIRTMPGSPYGLIGIGICVPGLVNRSEQIVLTPNTHWNGVDVKKQVEEAFNVPVTIENEANAGAYGEHIYGAAKAFDDFMYVSISTGIGVGLVLNNELYRGVHGFSGEMGHMTIDFNGPKCNCGNRGCWELYASEKAFRQSLPADWDEKELNKRFQQNDVVLFRSLENFGHHLGIGLVNIANTFDPEAIILRNPLIESNPFVLNAVKNTLSSRMNVRFETECAFLPSTLGKNAPALGACSMMIESFIKGITA